MKARAFATGMASGLASGTRSGLQKIGRLPLGAYFAVGLTFLLLLPAVVAFFVVMAPGLGLFLLRYVALLAFLIVGYKFSAQAAPWSVKLLLSVILGQVILNYGFSSVVIGAGPAKVTFPEAATLLFLAVIVPKIWSQFARVQLFWITCAAMIVPLLLHLPVQLPEYGLAAARDALTVIDLIYFLAGLALCMYGIQQDRWRQWRNRFLTTWMVAGLIYATLSPFSRYLTAISPVFESYQQPIPVFGYFITGHLNLIGAVAAISTLPFVFPKHRGGRLLMQSIALIMAMWVTITFQSRALYVNLAAVPFAFMLVGQARQFRYWVLGLIGGLCMLGLIEAYGIRIPGRISEVGLTPLVDRMLSISGSAGDDVGAEGVHQRRRWRQMCFDLWSETPATMIFGAGYGMALTDHGAGSTTGEGGVIVREPHNSYLSSLTRGGLYYLSLWLIIISAPMVCAWRGARVFRDSDPEFSKYSAWTFVLLSAPLITAIVEPYFETPSIAALFYFTAGIYLAEYFHKMKNAKTKVESSAVFIAPRLHAR